MFSPTFDLEMSLDPKFGFETTNDIYTLSRSMSWIQRQKRIQFIIIVLLLFLSNKYSP